MKKYMTFVFDDGPCEPMCEMVDLFKSYGFSGGFAIIGKKINDTTEPMLRYAVDNGFTLVSHSLTHCHLEKLGSREEIARELSAPIEEIERRLGYKITMARLPFISYNDEVLSVAKESGLVLLGQGIDGGGDWSGDADPKRVATAVLSSACDGAVGCLHVMNATLEALKTILPQLKEKGYILVTPEELFRIKNKSNITCGINFDLVK